MSKAFKCDRCGTCFDPDSMTDNDIFITLSEVFSQNKEEYWNHAVGGREEEIHFCPVCSKEFNRFMANSQEKEEKERKDRYEKAWMRGFTIGRSFHACDDYLEGRCPGYCAGSPNDPAEREKRSKKESKH